jgi:DNA (cytosine-5)-methyltransferase 1
MNVLDLCTGYGGFSLALRLLGDSFRTVCYVEWETYCQAVLLARMEEKALDPAPIWDDVTTFDGRRWRGKVDIITAGFPCTPFSLAGKRGGAEDPRYIWPSILRIIRETESRLVFLENVPGLLHTGFGEILKDLATAGYDAEWGVFSAQEVGAPHRRNRVFVLAYPHGQQLEILEGIPLYNEKECQTVARSMGISLWAASPSDFFGDADGSPARLDRLRILGNGIVPLQAAHAFRVLLQRLKDIE